MLNKEVCRTCCMGADKEFYSELFEPQWKSGFVMCPYDYDNGWDIRWDTDKDPHSKCPYAAEHVVSQDAEQEGL